MLSRPIKSVVSNTWLKFVSGQMFGFAYLAEAGTAVQIFRHDETTAYHLSTWHQTFCITAIRIPVSS